MITQKKVFAALPQVKRGTPVKLTGRGDNILYCHGKNVYIRNLKDPSVVDVYCGHGTNTTVARYSPSGMYIASADEAGKIRIWDTVNPEHVLKQEYFGIGGEVRDLDWSPDSKKIAVGGAVNETSARVFNIDTGTSVGEIANQGRVNSVAFSPVLPLRIVIASEDFTVAFYNGPPFSLGRTQRHNNFVNVARFSPDGNLIVSGGSEKKVFKYDAKTLDNALELSCTHGGGIYDLCFSADGKELLTASGDKTAKLISMETGSKLSEFGNEGTTTWRDMKMGCLLLGDEILTVNGYGHITYHDRSSPMEPKKVIKGHVTPITALALSEDKKTAFTGGQDGIVYWDVDSGDNDTISGAGHMKSGAKDVCEITDITVDGEDIISVGLDDTLRVSSVVDKKFSDIGIKLDSQPKGLDSRNGTIVVACTKHVIVLEGGRDAATKGGSAGWKKRSVLDVKEEPTCVSIHPDGSTVAVGFSEKKVGIYSLQNWTLNEQRVVTLEEKEAVVSCLAYSPDGALLTCGASKKVHVFNTSDYTLVRKGEKHTASVRCIGWSPDSRKFASGSIDSCLIIWEADMPIGDRPRIQAHPRSHINKLAWVDDQTVITAGQDSDVRQFTVAL